MNRHDPVATATPAQERVLTEVLGWGQPRPLPPPALLETVRTQLAGTVVAQRPDPVACTLHLGAVLRGDRERAGVRNHDRDTVRGILLARAFARDVEGRHTAALDGLLDEVVEELASERPGDPASASAWVNAAGAAAVADLRQELVEVLEDVRELWPILDRDRLRVLVRPVLRVEVAPGPTVVTVRPDLVLDSTHPDERARSLVLVTRTGMPRPREDRQRARATAMLTALATGRVPFRWITLHLTDGRAETEDLDPDILVDTARSLGGRIARLHPGTDPGAAATAQEHR